MADGTVGARPARLGDLGVRAASGLVLVAVAITTTLRGGDLFVIAWLAAAIAVLWEWQRLVGGAMLGSRLVIGVVALAVIAAIVRASLSEATLVLAIAAAVSAFVAGRGARGWAFAGTVYAGLLLLAVISLRSSFPFGGRAIFWLFATVWSTDVFAYFGGRLIGGPKLWPRVSPSKTWSGTLTGVVAGAIAGTIVGAGASSGAMAVLPVVLLSVVASVASQMGDAGESAMKRRFGVKDSSRLIPGHGGVMDRLDGFVAAAVLAFLFGLCRGLPSVAGALFYWT